MASLPQKNLGQSDSAADLDRAIAASMDDNRGYASRPGAHHN